MAPRGPLQLFCLQRPGPWTAATTPSLGDEVQAGRAGRGTETLRQVPEVRNLLRHLNQRELHAQKVPHAVAVAKERRGARGESREGCGLFQGGQRGCSWHLAGTASAWQPGGVWAGPGEAFLSLGVLQPSAGLRGWGRCGLHGRALCHEGERRPGKKRPFREECFAKPANSEEPVARNFGFGSRSPFPTRR